ncbi:hypothetical protein A2382_01730 [Candidatus Woesebacteria bacterium RIFOXYB1_FULL_38_16]|uniref:ZIP family metal transporter n=1 Tax=Candidatus Woesebacteria bacterium RIFOXYB1_FULL_38_16 TaxID=1802538 RepID=A0A1F8CUX8_9BACT|nr:MAG: hypothetical protein A2191_03305 [Candidatus Woesebacteria bacterium RIFOXYA1_FULL_38_9]OGM80143.1 MAG: hypothetical protein A2382_01730 [Candidatus Woesebacteria bacterium RIFOXYB1_FULL_38_16]
MSTLFSIIIATLFITTGAFLGVFTLSLAKDTLNKSLKYLMSLSAGALMGGAFLHLIPESLEILEPNQMSLIVLFAFITFFIIEKILHWRHCHKSEKCKNHTFGYMNLIGDSIHNFIDGIVIASAFVADYKLGLITTFAVAIHEIPQEISDYGVLLYSGFKKTKALISNFIVALTVVLGGIVGYYLSDKITNLVPTLTAFAAGGFIYIAASDLMPEIRKETNLVKSFKYFSVFILGLGVMYLLSI